MPDFRQPVDCSGISPARGLGIILADGGGFGTVDEGQSEGAAVICERALYTGLSNTRGWKDALGSKRLDT